MSDSQELIEYARAQLHKAVERLADESLRPRERLQSAWTNNVQYLWERKYLPDVLNDRFKEMWRRYTLRNEDPRTTVLRDLTDDDLERAFSELRSLHRDAQHWTS